MDACTESSTAVMEPDQDRTGEAEFSIEPEVLRQCRFLVGPTASGKTDLSLAIARHLPVEIILLDSMTIYQKMEIGTAKPTLLERSQVVHHGVDLIEPWEEFSVRDYLEYARTKVIEILSRQRVPLFVGGTGLYLRSLLRGLCESPPADWEFRRQLEEQSTKLGADWLHQEVAAIDPVTAARLNAADRRRLIRALEVYRLTGRPLSEHQQQVALPEGRRPRHVYWLNPPRDWLYARINARVNQMVEAGLKAEVEMLRGLTPPVSRTARQGLGYKEVMAFLEAPKGKRWEQVVEEIQTRTRQFAKRQMTWYRNLEEAKAWDLNSDWQIAQVGAEIAEKMQDI